MSEVTFTFQVDEALKNEFTQAACSGDYSGDELLRDFMRGFVQRHGAGAYDAWFRRQVALGQADVHAGDVLTSDEVEAEAEAWRAELGRKHGA